MITNKTYGEIKPDYWGISAEPPKLFATHQEADNYFNLAWPSHPDGSQIECCDRCGQYSATFSLDSDGAIFYDDSGCPVCRDCHDSATK